MEARDSRSPTDPTQHNASWVGRQPISATPYRKFIKPVMDRLLGLLLLILASPLMAMSALAILVSIGRPVFFSQPRVGLGGVHFQLYKLRTMIPDRRIEQRPYDGPDRRRTHKSPADPRVGRVGKALRALRFDELPQFWNVVKGEMSLVGPRPEMPQIVGQYEPWQHYRHAVKPGITGPWQISVQNGKLMHECTDIDIDYIHNLSLWNDLHILARTPAAMIGKRRGF